MRSSAGVIVIMRGEKQPCARSSRKGCWRETLLRVDDVESGVLTQLGKGDDLVETLHERFCVACAVSAIDERHRMTASTKRDGEIERIALDPALKPHLGWSDGDLHRSTTDTR